MIREVREETGLEVEPVRLIGVYSADMLVRYPNGDTVHGVGAAFECRITGGALRADHDEITEARFMPLAELLAQPSPSMAGMRQCWEDAAHPERWPVLR